MSLWRYLSSTKMIILSHTEEWGQNVWAWSHQNLQVSCILKCASCWHQNVRILEKKGHSFVSFNWAHEILPIFIILTYDVALSALSLSCIENCKMQLELTLAAIFWLPDVCITSSETPSPSWVQVKSYIHAYTHKYFPKLSSLNSTK